MLSYLTAVLLLALPLAATADDTTPSAGAPINYSSTQFGFSVSLPHGGMVSDKSLDPNWSEDPQTVVLWASTSKDNLITAIMVRVDDTDDGSNVNLLTYAAFMKGMAEQVTEDKQRTVLLSDPDYSYGGRRWGSMTVKDVSNGEPIYYTFMEAYRGKSFYSLVFYYSAEPPKELPDEVLKVLGSFKFLSESPASQ